VTGTRAARPLGAFAARSPAGRDGQPATRQSFSTRKRRSTGTVKMHTRFKSGMLALGIALACGCASLRGADSDPTPCPPDLEPYVRTTLYMGSSRYFAGDGWKRFTEEVLIKHLPAGGTVIENTSGWWRRPDGSTATGGGRLLVVLAPASEVSAHREGIRSVIKEIKRVTGHLSVGWEEDRLCAAF
jgi:hypothetical protein